MSLTLPQMRDIIIAEHDRREAILRALEAAGILGEWGPTLRSQLGAWKAIEVHFDEAIQKSERRR